MDGYLTSREQESRKQACAGKRALFFKLVLWKEWSGIEVEVAPLLRLLLLLLSLHQALEVVEVVEVVEI